VRHHLDVPRSELPPPLDTGPFSTARALGLGIGNGRLRGPDLTAPFHGVRSAARAADDVPGRARELAPRLRRSWCFTHLTALALWGLPLPPSLGWSVAGQALHVGSVGGRGPRRQGVVGHDLGGNVAIGHLGGLPLVDPVLAWRQSASLLSVDDLVAVGDALAGAWSAHEQARGLSISVLAAAVREAAGTRGAARLSEALALVRPGVESPKETELRLLLVRAGLPEPELNTRTWGRDGTYLGKPDLRWPDQLLSAEYEGDEHRRDRHRWRTDISRAERFADAGWRMVRVTEDDLHGRPAERLLTRLHHLLND
jgi:hypothetical protein